MIRKGIVNICQHIFFTIVMKKELCFDSIFGPSLSSCILGAVPCSLKPVSSCAALTININNLFSWQRRSSSFIEKAEFAFEVLDEEWTSTSQYWRPGAFSPTKILNTGCNTLQATKEGLQCAATQKKPSLETPNGTSRFALAPPGEKNVGTFPWTSNSHDDPYFHSGGWFIHTTSTKS